LQALQEGFAKSSAVREGASISTAGWETASEALFCAEVELVLKEFKEKPQCSASFQPLSD